MPRTATIRLQSLQTCLVNLPLSVYGQLVSRGVTPQSVIVCLTQLGNNTGISAAVPASNKGKSKDVASQQVYVGWSGLASRVIGAAAAIVNSQTLKESIEIDPICASELGLFDGQTVSIDLLRNLPAAQRVHIEPVTADDWEIAEIHADFLEQNLLSQVRAASASQHICAWVGPSKSLIRMRVVSTEPSDDIAVRLTIDTEVAIAPKSRLTSTSTAVAQQRHQLNTGATAKERSQINGHVIRKKTPFLLRLLPADAQIVGMCESACSVDGIDQDEDRAWVNQRTFKQVTEYLHTDHVLLERYLCPARNSKKATSDSQDGRAQAPDASQGHADIGDRRHVLVRLCVSVTLPKSSLYVSSSVRRSMPQDVVDFDLLQVSASVASDDDGNRHLANARSRNSQATANTTPDVVQPFAGFGKQIGDCLEGLRACLNVSVPATHRTGRSHGILITGASGCGKTSFLQQIERRAQSHPGMLAKVMRQECVALAAMRVSTLQQRLQEVFNDAVWHAPSLVIFDDLDRLAPAEVEHIDSAHSQQIANILLRMINEAASVAPVAIVATCQSQGSLHAAISQSHTFDEHITMLAPNKDARAEILRSWVQAKTITSASLEVASALNYVSLSTQTEGYLPLDLRDLVDRSVRQAIMRQSQSHTRIEKGLSPMTNIGMADFQEALKSFVPQSLRDVKLQKSETQWADIGGLHDTRRVLRETLEWPTKYGAIFATSPLRLRSGLLLYGYPGCGKTLLASAVAKECGLNFISVKGPELLNKYIGASEKSVRDLFERAQAARPCVLFFDEFDSIAPKRGHDSTGVTDRVVNQMLTQMDGAEGLEGVYVLAATSRPDLIDPALLRPGRLDKSLLCDMPNKRDRHEILKAASRKIALAEDIDFDHYAAVTEGYSGADLQAVMYNAHLDCIQASITNFDDAANAAATLAKSTSAPTWTIFGASSAGKGSAAVLSRAEEAVFQRTLEQVLKADTSSESRSRLQAGVAKRMDALLVQNAHIARSLQATRPSVPKDEIVRLRRRYEDFISSKERGKGGMPNGTASSEVGGRVSLM